MFLILSISLTSLRKSFRRLWRKPTRFQTLLITWTSWRCMVFSRPPPLASATFPIQGCLTSQPTQNTEHGSFLKGKARMKPKQSTSRRSLRSVNTCKLQDCIRCTWRCDSRLWDPLHGINAEVKTATVDVHPRRLNVLMQFLEGC